MTLHGRKEGKTYEKKSKSNFAFCQHCSQYVCNDKNCICGFFKQPKVY